MEISTELVPPGYELDPDTEILFLNGQNLQNGMVVLLADGFLRSSIVRGPQDYITLERARWCMIRDFYYEEGVIKFVGTYGDATSLVRTVDVHRPWIVKRNAFIDLNKSLEGTYAEATKKYKRKVALRTVVKEIIADSHSGSGITGGIIDEFLGVDDYVDKIMALFEEKS